MALPEIHPTHEEHGGVGAAPVGADGPHHDIRVLYFELSGAREAQVPTLTVNLDDHLREPSAVGTAPVGVWRSHEELYTVHWISM